MRKSIILIITVALISIASQVCADDWQDFHADLTIKGSSSYVLQHGMEACDSPVIQSILDIYLGDVTLEIFHSVSPANGSNGDYGDELDAVIMYGHLFEIDGSKVSELTGLKTVTVGGEIGFYDLVDLGNLEEENIFFSAIKLTGGFGPVLGCKDLSIYGRFEADTWQGSIIENQFVTRVGGTAKIDLPNPIKNIDFSAKINCEAAITDGHNPEGGGFELAHISPQLGLNATWKDLTVGVVYEHQFAIGNWIDDQDILSIVFSKKLW